MAGLPGPLTMITCSMPTFAASAMTSSNVGVETIGASSLGTDLVKGRKRVPRPAAGMRALRARGPVIPRRVTGQYFSVDDPDLASAKAELREELLAARRARP